jgi:TonB family protein
MSGTFTRGGLLAVLAAGVTSLVIAQPAPGPAFDRGEVEPLPQGQRIEVSHGDTVVVDTGAWIRLVQRDEGMARILADRGRGALLILLDRASREAGPPDGLVDYAFSFRNLEGDWPLGTRWDGLVTLERYTVMGGPSFGQGPPAGFGLHVEGVGLIHLAPSSRALPPPFHRGAPGGLGDPDPSALVSVTADAAGARFGVALPFEQAEEQAKYLVEMPGGRDVTRLGALTPGVRSGTGSAASASLDVIAPVPAPLAPNSDSSAPLRVGGPIRPPKKVHHHDPVYPDEARAARIAGVVIVELTVAPDGSVQDARVLRSILMLDQPALEAVRQWRFEPTLLNGAPVPVVMTVTVPFAMEPQ